MIGEGGESGEAGKSRPNGAHAAAAPGGGKREIAPTTSIRNAWTTGPWRRLIDFFLGPVDAIQFTTFRALFLYSLVAYSVFRWGDAGEWLTAAGFHPSPAASEGLQVPLPLIPEAWLIPFGLLYFGILGAAVLGIRPRLANWLVLAAFAYVSYADRLAAFTINKLFLAGLMIIALAPLVPGRGPGGRETLRSAWPLRALQATLVLQLFGAGICKIRLGPWLDQSDVLWHQVQLAFMTDAAAWMVRELPMSVWAGLQHLALGYELAAPALLLIPRLRPLGFVLGAGMFAMIAVTMDGLVFFSAQLMTFYVLFVDRGRLRRWRAALARG